MPRVDLSGAPSRRTLQRHRAQRRAASGSGPEPRTHTRRRVGQSPRPTTADLQEPGVPAAGGSVVPSAAWPESATAALWQEGRPEVVRAPPRMRFGKFGDRRRARSGGTGVANPTPAAPAESEVMGPPISPWRSRRRNQQASAEVEGDEADAGALESPFEAPGPIRRRPAAAAPASADPPWRANVPPRPPGGGGYYAAMRAAGRATAPTAPPSEWLGAAPDVEEVADDDPRPYDDGSEHTEQMESDVANSEGGGGERREERRGGGRRRRRR